MENNKVWQTISTSANLKNDEYATDELNVFLLIVSLRSAELSLPDLPAYVELHALKTAQCVC